MSLDKTNVVNEESWALTGDSTASLTRFGFIGEGGITVNAGQNWIPQLTGSTGEAPLDFYDNGQTIEVSIQFAESVNFDLWTELFAMGDKQEDTDTPANERFVSHPATMTQHVGTSGLTLAKFLVIRPQSLYVDEATETVRDFVIPEALCTQVDAIEFTNTAPRVLAATFSGIYVPGTTDGSNLWSYGLYTEGAGSWS